MNERGNYLKILPMAIAFILTSGCEAQVPAQAPTSEPTLAIHSERIAVTYDENGCSYSGPTVLSPGNQVFVYQNLSEDDVDFWVGIILEGKTYQDLLDAQDEPGQFIPAPSWISHPKVLETTSDESARKVEFTIALTKAGEYYTTVGSYFPPIVWFCGSFEVEEGQSK